MTERISPATRIRGLISVPGDKSISHRYAMLTSIAQGDSTLYNYSSGADCQSTLSCLERLGITHAVGEEDGRRVLTVHGKGLRGLQPPPRFLDAGNSGSTMRMLSGILAAQSFTSEISGDSSLVQRPMRRIIAPLSEMGARIDSQRDGFPPLTIYGSPLRAIDYAVPIPSAQVKSCVLLAGLYADGETIVRETTATRDHTEIALSELGAEITVESRLVRLVGGGELTGKRLVVPGDLSSAAFFLVAALLVSDADLTVTNVGLNPTRANLLDLLRSFGAPIKILHLEQINGELVGTLQIKSGRVRGGVIEGATTAALIDEIPILSVLGARSEEGLVVKDAAELRVKETDRIEAIATNLRRMGATVETTHDGLNIPGRQTLEPAEVESFGDHRIAMAFAVAALAARGECLIHDADAAAVSFPEFFETLRHIVQ